MDYLLPTLHIRRTVHLPTLRPTLTLSLTPAPIPCAAGRPARGAQALTRPSPSSLTASAVCGFASFLSLLAHHDFASEPLLLETDSPFTTELRDKAAAAFADARARAKGASAGATASSSPSAALARSNPTQTGTSASEVVVWIATPQEVEGSACCFDRSPSAQTVSRLRSVASACLSQLDTLATTSASGLEYQDAVAATSAAAVAAAAKDTTAATKDAASAAVAATDRASAALMSACFDAPLGQYDLLLELKPSKLPRSHLEWVGSAAAAARGDGRDRSRASTASLPTCSTARWASASATTPLRSSCESSTCATARSHSSRTTRTEAVRSACGGGRPPSAKASQAGDFAAQDGDPARRRERGGQAG